MPASAPTSPLPPDRLYRQADIAALRFETTRELAPLRDYADQPRAHEAIRFGTEMAVRGFNIFAIGANGAHIQEHLPAKFHPVSNPAVIWRAGPGKTQV